MGRAGARASSWRGGYSCTILLSPFRGAASRPTASSYWPAILRPPYPRQHVLPDGRPSMPLLGWARPHEPPSIMPSMPHDAFFEWRLRAKIPLKLHDSCRRPLQLCLLLCERPGVTGCSAYSQALSAPCNTSALVGPGQHTHGPARMGLLDLPWTLWSLLVVSESFRPPFLSLGPGEADLYHPQRHARHEGASVIWAGWCTQPRDSCGFTVERLRMPLLDPNPTQPGTVISSVTS